MHAVNPILSQEYFEALSCPACGVRRLLLTKEKIIICQSCLNGYKIQGDVPNFRLEFAISFRKKIKEQICGVNVLFTLLTGGQKNQSCAVKIGHCVVFGRLVKKDDVEDLTVVSKPPSVVAYNQIDPESYRVIEQFMTHRKGFSGGQNQTEASLFDLQNRNHLGSFVRDPDFLVDDASVSRTHAVVYQDEKGVHLLDLVSKNGSFVNGKEVEQQGLKDNDIINLGQASVRVSFY